MLEKRNKQKIRQRALLEAIRICGGVSAYSQQIKVSRSRASNWRNRPEIEIPFEYAVLTAHMTKVSIDRLSPSTESANNVLRQLAVQYELSTLSMEVDQVVMGDHRYSEPLNLDHRILIGTDGVLISGLNQIKHFKSLGINKIPVKILDLEALFLGKVMIQKFKSELLISEEVAIGLRLESLLGNRQGQRNDLKPSALKNRTLLPMWGEVKGRKDILVAKCIGYSTNTYYRAKRVYLFGSSQLIDAVDRKEISIAEAAEKINRVGHASH